MRFKLLAAAVLFTTPALVLAKPLTVCTESSPDGFDVVQFNSLVTTNASARRDLQHAGLLRRSHEESRAVAGRQVGRQRRRPHLHVPSAARTCSSRPPTTSSRPARSTPTTSCSRSSACSTTAIRGTRSRARAAFRMRSRWVCVKLIKSVSKVDDNTVKFELNAPERDLRADPDDGFRVDLFGRIRRSAAQGDKQTDLNAKPIGTGPFVLKSYTKDAVIRYDVNPTYWGPKPKMDRLIYAITPDAIGARAENQGGRMPDRVVAEAAGRRSMRRATSRSKVMQTPAFMTAFVALNTQKKPLDNQKVRQALNDGVRSHDVSEDRVRQHGDAGRESVSRRTRGATTSR